jgi:aryl-alcohol dehydrogenase-like predicted oxidoreductase
VIKGGWHLAGGHGAIDPAEALRDMAMFVDAGITTFDCADIYTGVEALIGRFRREYPAHARQLQVHTKFVPDLPDLATLDGRRVEAVIDRSLARLGMEQLDLVQFHWWDFGIPRHVEIAQELNRLRRAGKIARIGVTNFDVPRLAELCAAGIPVAFHQLQYSLLDDRPRHGMTDYCRSQGIALLCYGTVCGGFLSERWLGQPPPVDPSNRSLIKYRLIIEEFGGWELFQELLRALARVAGPGGDIASVASRAILDRDTVAAVIIGAVDASHVASHARLHALRLTREELSMLAAIADRRLGPLGDVYELERDRTGPHGRIMKYDLNALP